MSAPTLDRPPATSQSTSSPARRRPLLLLVATSLLVVAAAVGTSLALANRPSARPSAAAIDTAAAAPNQPADQVGDQPTKPDGQTKPNEGTRANDDTKPQDSGTGPVDTAKDAPVLPDGTHHAYIRKVDAANDRITVDVVQLFLDGDAVKAAIADGKPRDEARYLMVWLRNENPRLRTLPLAANLSVDLFKSCDESSDRRALLDKLAGNVRQGIYFYTLTVRDGAVRGIKERQITPAC